MKNNKVRTIAYIAVYAALCLALEWVSQFIPFLQMPQGGSIELGYAALFVAAYHLGAGNGVIVGLLWWLLGWILGMNAYYLNPMQYLLDYVLPVVVCGLASVYWPKKNKKTTMTGCIAGIVIGMILKYACTVLSGVFYWPPEGEAAGSTAAWLFSLNYNAWYNLATMVVCIILTPLLMKRLKKI